MGILPHLYINCCLKLQIYRKFEYFGLDKFKYCGIIKRTPTAFGVHNVVAVRADTKKGIFPQGRRYAQYDPGKSQSHRLSGRRIFRPSRHCPGQIRNAASRACGKRNSNGSGRRIWIFPQYLLSDQFKFRRSRNKRPYSGKTWPSRSSQSQFRDIGLSQRLCERGETHPGAQACHAGATEIWPRNSPQDNRTCTVWKKNAAVKPDTTTTSEEEILADTACMSRRYEKFRRAAMGEAALAEDRSGLVLFLRHGMICWIKGLYEAEFFQKQQAARCSQSTEFVTLNQNNTVIKIFAAMTLHTPNKKKRAT